MATQTTNGMNRKIHEGACLLLVPGGPELPRKHWCLLFSFTALKKKKNNSGDWRFSSYVFLNHLGLFLKAGHPAKLEAGERPET